MWWKEGSAPTSVRSMKQQLSVNEMLEHLQREGSHTDFDSGHKRKLAPCVGEKKDV